LGLKRKEVKLSKEELTVEKKQLAMQKDMHFWAKWRHKAGLIKFKKIAKGGLGALLALIGLPLMALGVIIGAQVALIAKPFMLIGKFIAGLLVDSKVLTKWSRMLKIMFAGKGKFAKFFTRLRKLFKFFSRIPLIGHLIKGLKIGFQKLFLPLQLIISAIDFVKGFMDTEGTIYEKIKGGVKNVIVKFLEFPAQLLGKIWEWFQVNFLGKDPQAIEKGAATKGLIKGIGNTVDLIFKGWELIFGGLGTAFDSLLDVIKGIDWQAFKDKMIGWGNNLTGVYGKIKEFILGLFGIDTTEKARQERYEKELFGLKGGGGTDEATALRNLRTRAEDARAMGNTAEAEKLELQRKQLETAIEANRIADKTLKFMETNPNGTFMMQNNSTEPMAMPERVEELERGR
jgi:hypothetical protein